MAKLWILIKIIPLMMSIFLMGCVTASKEVQDMSKELLFVGDDICQKLFIGGGPYSYQHFAMFNDGGDESMCGDVSAISFAFAKDANGVACAWSSFQNLLDAKAKGVFSSCKGAYTQEELDAHAIGRCEATKIELKSGVQAACKIYARGNLIVWEKEDGEALDFD